MIINLLKNLKVRILNDISVFYQPDSGKRILIGRDFKYGWFFINFK